MTSIENPFLVTQGQQPPAMISDAAAQQFAPQQQAQGIPQSLPGQAPQQFAPASPEQLRPVAFAAGHGYYGGQGLPQAPDSPYQPQGAPWTPQQHEQYDAMRQAGVSAAPQGYAPVQQPQAAAPVAHQPQQQFAPQAPAQASPPMPQFAAQQPNAGMPAFAMPGGAVDPSIFGAPAAGGGGRKPAWRDIKGRFVLIRVTARGVMRDAYDKSKPQEPTLDARIAVLDGGQIIMSPKQGDPSSVAEVFANETPAVIDDMIVTSKGLQNRLKNDFTRGRIVREPINDLQKHLRELPGDEPLWLKLEHWLAQDPRREHDFKQSIMWSIVADESDAANQMTIAFVQSPEGQRFCQ